MNLAELRAAVRNRCGFNANDSLNTADALNADINEANWDLADEHDWPWLVATETITTVAGTATVAVASDWLATIALHSTSPYMTRIEPVSIDDIDYHSDGQGVPRLFAAYGGSLALAPVPDAAYSLRHRYRRAEPELTADTDTPLSPASLHRAIVSRAAALAFSRDGNIVESRVADDDYRRRVERARKRLNVSGNPVLPRVRPGSGWG